MARANRVQEFQPVGSRHIVVAHDTVDRVRFEPFERGLGTVFGDDLDGVTFPFEIDRDEVGEVGVVVDVENRRRGPTVQALEVGSTSGSVRQRRHMPALIQVEYNRMGRNDRVVRRQRAPNTSLYEAGKHPV